jgi:hypothetical protein
MFVAATINFKVTHSIVYYDDFSYFSLSTILSDYTDIIGAASVSGPIVMENLILIGYFLAENNDNSILAIYESCN